MIVELQMTCNLDLDVTFINLAFLAFCRMSVFMKDLDLDLDLKLALIRNYGPKLFGVDLRIYAY